MNILVTGANGQLGNEMRCIAATSLNNYIFTDVAELDITDLDAIRNMIHLDNIKVIVNCAAYTNVDKAEDDYDMADLLNNKAVENLAIAAKEVNATLIHISTDYVFQGDKNMPCGEDCETNPLGIYGKTKRAGEQSIQRVGCNYLIFRTAWLYSQFGKNFVKTMVRASKTYDEVSVVCDQFGSPTSAVELAKMIHFLEGTDNYGIFHATCEGETNWADFTEAFYKKLGIKTKVNHITSQEYANMNPDAAKRPAYSNLDNYMLRLTTDQFAMANWEDALDVYLKDFDMENC